MANSSSGPADYLGGYGTGSSFFASPPFNAGTFNNNSNAFLNPSANNFEYGSSWKPPKSFTEINYNAKAPTFTDSMKSGFVYGGNQLQQQQPQPQQPSVLKDDQKQPSAREQYRDALWKKLPEALSSGLSNVFGSSGGGISAGNANVYSSGDLTFVQPGTITTPAQQGVFSKVLGVAAPIVGLMGGPAAPFIAAGLGGLSRVV
jgi:hypothetical protein